jgi:hypothetical protein
MVLHFHVVIQVASNSEPITSERMETPGKVDSATFPAFPSGKRPWQHGRIHCPLPARGLLTLIFNHVVSHLPQADMPSCRFINICIPLFGRLGRRAPSPPLPSRSRSHSPTHESIELTSDSPDLVAAPIYTLNDDVLLNIFYIFQLDILYEEQDQAGTRTLYWSRHRWWYKLAQVCQWWRKLIFASPSRLNLHLFFTNGAPVADMLMHSPPLPLVISYTDRHRMITAEDEENIQLALQYGDRVHHINLVLPASSLQRLIMAINGQFPILDRINIISSTINTALDLPRTFRAPLLHTFALRTASLPIGSPLLTTTVGLVILVLEDIPSSAYFPPSHILTRLSLMHQLEKLVIRFHSPLPSSDIEPQLSDASVMAHITLPNLRFFFFRGVSAYLERLLARIRAPLLSNFEIVFFNQLTFTIPHFSQFMRTTEILEFSAVQLNFSDFGFFLNREYPGSVGLFYMRVIGRDLDWQVSCAVQILSALSPVLSVTGKLTITHTTFDGSSEWHNEVSRTQWRELLRPFSNVGTLRVQNELVKELSRSLHSEDEEESLDLLSNLTELQCSGGSNDSDAFKPFIEERQGGCRPVNLRMVDHSEFPNYTQGNALAP